MPRPIKLPPPDQPHPAVSSGNDDAPASGAGWGAITDGRVSHAPPAGRALVLLCCQGATGERCALDRTAPPGYPRWEGVPAPPIARPPLGRDTPAPIAGRALWAHPVGPFWTKPVEIGQWGTTATHADHTTIRCRQHSPRRGASGQAGLGRMRVGVTRASSGWSVACAGSAASSCAS